MGEIVEMRTALVVGVICLLMVGCGNKHLDQEDYRSKKMACLSQERYEDYEPQTSPDGFVRLYSQRCDAYYKMGAAGTAVGVSVTSIDLCMGALNKSFEECSYEFEEAKKSTAETLERIKRELSS